MSDVNPFAPIESTVAEPTESESEWDQLARDRRRLILCWLLQLTVFGVGGLSVAAAGGNRGLDRIGRTLSETPSGFALMIIGGFIGVVIYLAVFGSFFWGGILAARLSRWHAPAWVAVLIGAVSGIPLYLGWLLIPWVAWRAGRTLRAAGWTVGWIGAREPPPSATV